MPDVGSLVQKAVYLGIGIADYAAEKARVNIQEITERARQLADEMVARGQMNLDEARRYVDDLVQQAQQQQTDNTETSSSREPRPIEIVVEEDQPPASAEENVEELRQQIESLQEELRKMRKE